MKYRSKGYVFDEEVTAWLDSLKAIHGSYNKALRLIAFPVEKALKRDVSHPARELVADLDAVGPDLSSQRGNPSIETRRMRDKGDTKR